VTLTVLDKEGNQVKQGNRHTIAIGKKLHMVAVTAAKPLPPFGNLGEGIIYQYDLTFNFDDGSSMTLATTTAGAAIAYSPFTLPSFCLPPTDPNNLRLMQGSCRIPHGNGKDALALLDDLIAQAASNPIARPHQLLLTGDQIYADDVSDAMSLLLSDAGDTLLGWTEEYISTVPLPGTRRPATDLHPELRENFLKEIGFTSEDLRCHLVGLGEYLSMYIFVWSDVIWPSALPSFEELKALFNNKISAMDEEILGGMVGLPESRRNTVKAHNAALEEFRITLPKVRRVLANIPSYMILDDHEVTDDWNMTRNICRKIYGTPSGLRIVQNALVAYALCQHWGNAPEQFENVSLPLPGFKLLQLLDVGTAATYEQNSATIRKYVGVHDDTTLEKQPEKALFHDQDSLLYHFTVEGTGHQVIFTDTRTWRSFPNGSDEAPHLLPKKQIEQQILNTPPTGERVLLVVLTTNAPPVQPIRTATRHSTIANAVQHFPDIYESWELPSVPFDRLIKTLTDKLPLVKGQRYGPVILLSGDVHFSFASRLLYKATSRFEDQQPQAATAVFAQLVASSLRKQTNDTLGFHREGYRYARFGTTKWLVPKHRPEGYVGWNLPVGSVVSTGWAPFKLNDSTTMALPQEENIFFEFSPVPDYSYRLDYLLATKEIVLPPSLPPIPPLPAGATEAQRNQAAKAFHAATGGYRIYNAGDSSTREIVGVNNLGEITFDWGDGDNKEVKHTLRWWNSSRDRLLFTSYVVSLDPNHAKFQEIKPIMRSP
jgi:hypothetical protein